jgi:hypothetical protein
MASNKIAETQLEDSEKLSEIQKDEQPFGDSFDNRKEIDQIVAAKAKDSIKD